ncbi:hypothetical protein Btru_044299 [Bulinus truncatus]|nr:hypothetical protein Btru_044299 [Bulinus truncatus]
MRRAYICSSSCDGHQCTYDGYCRQCPNGTRGRHCFEGCGGWCKEEEEENLVQEETSESPTTPKPAHRGRGGFRMENYWFYLMMVMALICVICVSAINAPKEAPAAMTNLNKAVPDQGLLVS